MAEYLPIPCHVHDRLEALAVRREEVRVEYTASDGSEREARGAIADLWTESGAEYLRTEDGTVVRLDHVRAVVVSAGGRIEVKGSG